MVAFHQILQQIRVIVDLVVVDLQLKGVGLLENGVDESVFESVGFQVGRGESHAVVEDLTGEKDMVMIMRNGSTWES